MDTLARHGGDLEQAAHHLRRALESEPYDERTYQELIAVLAAAGRHGEADETYVRSGGGSGGRQVWRRERNRSARRRPA